MQNQPEYKDLTLICVECGRAFTITLSEQKFYNSKSMPLPRRCPACRASRRATINRIDDQGRYDH